jgi:phosphodiesterase/alkaline phosphatase D-like protein
MDLGEQRRVKAVQDGGLDDEFPMEQNLAPRPRDQWAPPLPAARAKPTPFDGELREEVTNLLSRYTADAFDRAFIPTPTLTSPDDGAWIFLASCQYPSGLLDRKPAWNGYRRLAETLRESGRDNTDGNSLLVLTGDQIYSDATAGLFDPTDMDDRYRAPYDALFSQPEVRAVLRQVPSVMMLDDHEIAENWEPRMSDVTDAMARIRPVVDTQGKEGMQAYYDFQRRTGRRPAGGGNQLPNAFWFETNAGGVPVFVADTRTQRTPRTPGNLHRATIMDDDQHAALEAWLLEQKGKGDAPKFIVSPAIMFPFRRHTQRWVHEGGPGSGRERTSQAGVLRSDAWEGYPYSMARVLDFIATKAITNVVFLSGDEHLFCLASAKLVNEVTGVETRLHSVHGSPLYAPFPFANAHPGDFVPQHKIRFQAPISGNRYECTVQTMYKCCNGFAEIDCSRQSGKWEVKVRFHDADSDAAPGWHSLIDPRGGTETGAFAPAPPELSCGLAEPVAIP